MKLLRTDHKNIDFQNLVKTLNLELSVVDGELHDFYSQFNGTESLDHVVVAYKGDKAIGCGAFKHFDEAVVEIKRMYTPPSGRKKGTAAMVLKELEVWAKELGNKRCVLETGKNLPEAVGLYKKFGYNIIPNYEPYKETDNSLCFERLL